MPEAKRKRTRKHKRLTDTEQLDIAHRVLIDQEYYADVARGMRLSVSRISAIVKKVNTNENIF